LVLAPLVLVAARSGNSDWLLAAIDGPPGPAPLGVVLHGLAITAGFMTLLAALATSPLLSRTGRKNIETIV
jgi:hypothetical protein